MKTTLTVQQIMDLGLWEKVCEYKGWSPYLANEEQIGANDLVEFDSSFIRERIDNPFDEPMTLESMIDEVSTASVNKDFSDEYIIENNLPYPSIGEYTYGTAYVPCSWVLPYLLELKELREKN